MSEPDYIQRLRAWNEGAASVELPIDYSAGSRLFAMDVHALLEERDAIRAQNERLRESLQWMVDNDETNEGDEPDPDLNGRSWNEINAYWIEGLNRARAVLEEPKA